jgi:hypothetical protein
MGRIKQQPKPVPKYTSVMRHFAIVVNGSSPGVTLYVDGEKVGNTALVSKESICAASVSALHSFKISNVDSESTGGKLSKKAAKESAKAPQDTFFFGAQDASNPPESSVSSQTPMLLQQARVYASALTGAQVQAIHEKSRSRAGNKLRTCSSLQDPQVKDDSVWTDEFGHDCAWYANTRLTSPFICSSADVRQKCLVACAVTQCYVDESRIDSYNVGRQIEMFTNVTASAPQLCVASSRARIDKTGLPTLDDAEFTSLCEGERNATLYHNLSVLPSSAGAIGTMNSGIDLSVPIQVSWEIGPDSDDGNVSLVITSIDIVDDIQTSDEKGATVVVRPPSLCGARCGFSLSVLPAARFLALLGRRREASAHTLQVYDKMLGKPLASFRATNVGVTGVRHSHLVPERWEWSRCLPTLVLSRAHRCVRETKRRASPRSC